MSTLTAARLTTIDAIATQLLGALLSKGGASINLEGDSPAGGYMVSLPTSELRVSGVPTLYLIRAWLLDVAIPRMGEGDYIGAWFDDATGHSYLDISRNIPDLVSATTQGQQWKQKALFDVVNANVISLD